MAKKSMTAADLMAELANDPEYQRKIETQEKARAAEEAKLREEEKGLVQALQTSGVEIVLDSIPGQEYTGPPRSISDLVNTKSSYANAIPVLVEHLQLNYSPSIRKAIAGALATPDSKGNSQVLMRVFESERDTDSEFKWLVGAAISESAVESDAEKIIELANDECHGRGREFLPLGLVQAIKETVLPTLNLWADDPVLGKNARKAIGLLR